MIGWRLIKSRYADDPLSTEGARVADGRWHAAGTPILYCSEHLSLAALEVLVHLAPDFRHASFVALEINIPDEPPMTSWDVNVLPVGWRTVAGNRECRERGTAWAATRSTLLLSVPSAVAVQERNLLLNAGHPAFARVRVKSRAPFAFDPRLVPSRPPALAPAARPDLIASPRRGRLSPSPPRSPRRAGERRS